MLQTLKLPELSRDPEAELTVSEWYRRPGESFRKDDPLAEILFDKAAFDFNAPSDGRLVEIYVPAGGKGRPGDPLALIETEGEEA